MEIHWENGTSQKINPHFSKTDLSSKPKKIFAPTCNYFPPLGSHRCCNIWSFLCIPSQHFWGVFSAKKWVWNCLNLEVKRWNSEVFQGRVCRKANGSGSREREEVAAGADKKIERTQDIHQLYSASQTFQIFEPLNIDILPKGYSWTQEHKRKGKVWKGSCSLARTIVDFFVNLIFHIHILEDVENMKDEVAKMDNEINENQAHEVDDANKMGKMTRRWKTVAWRQGAGVPLVQGVVLSITQRAALHWPRGPPPFF